MSIYPIYQYYYLYLTYETVCYKLLCIEVFISVVHVTVFIHGVGTVAIPPFLWERGVWGGGGKHTVKMG